MDSKMPKPVQNPGNQKSREPSDMRLHDGHFHHSPETCMTSLKIGPMSRDSVTMLTSNAIDEGPTTSRNTSKSDSLANTVQQLQRQVAQNTKSLRNQRQNDERLKAAISDLKSDFSGISKLTANMRIILDKILELIAKSQTDFTIKKTTEMKRIKVQIELLNSIIKQLELLKFRPKGQSVTSVTPSASYHTALLAARYASPRPTAPYSKVSLSRWLRPKQLACSSAIQCLSYLQPNLPADVIDHLPGMYDRVKIDKWGSRTHYYQCERGYSSNFVANNSAAEAVSEEIKGGGPGLSSRRHFLVPKVSRDLRLPHRGPIIPDSHLVLNTPIFTKLVYQMDRYQ